MDSVSTILATLDSAITAAEEQKFIKVLGGE